MRLGSAPILRTLAAIAAAGLSFTMVQADSSPTTDFASIQIQLGDQLMAETRYEEAIEAYRLAVHAPEPSLRRLARLGLVRSSIRIASFASALQEAEVLRQAFPRDPEAVGLHGDSLWAAGLFDEAEQAYRDAVAIHPQAARGRHGLAKSLAAQSRFQQATDSVMAALAIDPRDAEYHHTLGTIYERQHRYEEAANAFSSYVNLLPNKDRSVKASWSRAQIRFLRSFGEKVPFALDADTRNVTHTVPFKLVDDKVVVQGKINGSSAMDLVLDTGAEQTVVSRVTARRLGITPIVYTLTAGVGEIGLRGLQVGRLDRLEIGSLKMQNVPVLIKNPALTNMPRRESESFSPLSLGLSMTIDYQKRQLTFGRRLPEEKVDFELPLRLHRLATVRGVVDNSLPTNFVVDTGGEVISISAETASSLPPAPRRIPLKVYGTSGWDRDAYLLPGVDLAFSAIAFENLPVVVLNLRAPSVLLGYQIGGIVGHRFLSRYRVTLDMERSVMRLTTQSSRRAAA
ncbi:MAG: aspartyl protease family protein, partial [Acidobacteria bacterium]|nr:aspartyl protease family protein [Acidobacteriota bacterium]